MIGFDIEHISRIKNADKLLEKIATSNEIAYIEKFKDKNVKVATLWAVKEAVFKSLEICAGDISYKEIELSHLSSGQPKVELFGKAKEFFSQKGATSLEISISHSLDLVGAVVLLKF